MEKMDAPWLNKANLEEWLKTSVLEIVLNDLELKGDNYMSNMYRLQVKTKEGDKALIVKCRLEDSEVDAALADSSIFKKEENVYSNTLPRMDKMLRETFRDDLEPLAPHCFYSCEDFLVMENMSAEGYKMLDRCKGLDLEQCLTVMRTIARFHAASVVLHEQDPQYIKKYDSSFSDNNSLNSWNTFFEAMAKLLIEELETWPAEQWRPYIGKLRNIQQNFFGRLHKLCKRNDSEFNVLIHGDLWTNNILFRGDVARLIDFQNVQFTSPGIDLNLFLTTSPNMEVRINHTDKLIQEYHATLSSTLTALGSKKLPTLEEVYQMYRSKAFYGIFGVVTEAAAMTADPNSGFSLDEALKGRTPGRQMYSEFFRNVVKWNFPILDSMGAFDFN